jgi:enoyl-CoA hydratase/carnithine racemase
MHRKHAMEMALTGDMLSAEDAVRMGLLNRAVPAEALEEETMALARRIAQRSSQGIASGKSAFYQQIDMPLEQAFEFATEVMVNGFDSDDGREGVDAFLQKRAPKWRGL